MALRSSGGAALAPAPAAAAEAGSPPSPGEPSVAPEIPWRGVVDALSRAVSAARDACSRARSASATAALRRSSASASAASFFASAFSASLRAASAFASLLFRAALIGDRHLLADLGGARLGGGALGLRAGFGGGGGVLRGRLVGAHSGGSSPNARPQI